VIYVLPLDLPTDMGVRAASYFMDTDTLDIIGTSLMLLSSGETIVDGLHIYGGVGADLSIAGMNAPALTPPTATN